MDQAVGIDGGPKEPKENLRNVVEMVKSMSDKHLYLLRLSARYYTGSKGFLVGFVCPPMWYLATVLCFGSFYQKDLRERAGLAASAIAAMMSTFLLLVIGAVPFTR